MKDYEHFSTIDFATDEDFLQDFLNPTETSELRWREWLVCHPNQVEAWEEARKLIEAVQQGLTDYARTFLSAEAEDELLNRIRQTNRERGQANAVIWMNPWVRVAAAACLLLTLYLAGSALLNRKGIDNLYDQRVAELQSKTIEIFNTGDKLQTYYLPDQTEVVLSPASRLSYTSDYSKDTRTVLLSGKATFDVKKNPQKPFYVYANEIATKVLGTRFEVSALEDGSEVLVKVKSGMVSVYKIPLRDMSTAKLSAERKGVMLLPNQQAVFRRATEQFEKVLIDEPTLLPTYESQQFVYEEYPIIQVLEEIEAAYGIEIVRNDEILKHCELTANLTDESLTRKLTIVCRSIGATYEVFDARIIINSNGCVK